MQYRERRPHASLSDHVKCFWTLEHEHRGDDRDVDVMPDACVELILDFGAPYVFCADDGSEREMPRAFVVGLERSPLRFRCDGTVKVVAARFFAWGALPFLGGTGRSRDALELGPEWNGALAAAEARVLEGDYDGAVNRVEEFLLARLPAASDGRRIQIAARTLYREKGQVTVADLAERCFLSVRQVERHVHDATGMSPKALARLVRFDAVRERLMFEPDASLTGLAHECGYSDQAHFNRDFREFAGRTPSEFADEVRSLRAAFRDGNVVFLRE